MIEIGNTKIYVGNKSGYCEAVSKGMKIVCAHRNGSTGVSHQSLAGWKGMRSCPKDSPHYLYYLGEDIIALNMVDGENPEYIPDEMINKAIDFIDLNIDDRDIFIYCSEGRSRGPSIALIYLLEKGLINSNNAFEEFKQLYPLYSPKDGNRLYIKNRYNL